MDQKQASITDTLAFVEDLKQRVVFENLASLVTKCTRQCVKDFDSMYLNKDEEVCAKNCYAKSFDF